jgi:hypothetical protein
MRCDACDRELPPHDKECPHCREKQGEVTVLSRQEREGFKGITLDSDPNPETDTKYYEYRSDNGNQRIYVRQVSFGSGKMSIWTKLLIAAVLGVLVFFVLPMFFMLVVGIGLVWFVLNLFRR